MLSGSRFQLSTNILWKLEAILIVTDARGRRIQDWLSGCQVASLYRIYDALEELSELSLEVQKRGIALPVAHRAIARQIMVFDALCEKSGPHLTIVDEVLHNKNAAVFKGVPLHSLLANATTC